jgi:hypothetical protein
MYKKFYTTAMCPQAKVIQKRFSAIRNAKNIPHILAVAAVCVAIAALAASVFASGVFSYSFGIFTKKPPTAAAIPSGDAEKSELARRWAEAVKMRDGKAQYALMSISLQEKVRGGFEAMNWVTGVSSPWVEAYKVVDGDFSVTFVLATSTGSAGNYSQRLSFIKEDGVLRIDAISDPFEDESEAGKQAANRMAYDTGF